MSSYEDRIGDLYEEIDSLKHSSTRLIDALEGIGNMHIGQDTNFQQLSALQSAIALTTLKEIEAKS